MLFEIQTVQTQIIKSLFETLKEIYIDMNFTINGNGIHANIQDNTGSIRSHLFLENLKFEKFICEHGEHVIGLDLNQTYKILKNIPNSAIITLFMTETEPEILKILVENPNDNITITYKIKLMNIAHTYVNIPKVDFDLSIVLPVTRFSKILKNLSIIDNNIEIRSLGNDVTFISNGLLTSAEVSLVNDENVTITRNCDPKQIIHSVYDLKQIMSCVRSSNLSQSIEINIKPDYMFLIRYEVGTLGVLSLSIDDKINA